MSKLLISSDPFVVRVAKVSKKGLEFFLMKKRIDSNSDIVGNVYKGRVANIANQLGAAFVDIGLDKNAFLCIDKHCLGSKTLQELGIRENSEIMVQVCKPIVSTKGPKVTLNISLAGNNLVLLCSQADVAVSKHIEDKEKAKELRSILKGFVEDGMGFIARTASRYATVDELKVEADYLKSVCRKIKEKFKNTNAPSLLHSEPAIPVKMIREHCSDETQTVLFDDYSMYESSRAYLRSMGSKCYEKLSFFEQRIDMFEFFGVKNEIEKLSDNTVRLKNGGYLIIEKTEAFFAIDVNAGSYHYTENSEDAIFDINMQAAYEIFRQINLRDIGGLVVVDFIDMTNTEHREKLQQLMQKLAKANKRKTYVGKLTSLSLMEMSIKKDYTDIFDEMFEKCSDCYNGGLIKSVPLICSEIYNKIRYSTKSRFKLKATPSVLEMFKRYYDLDKKIDFYTMDSCNPSDYILEVVV
ncbi:Rne/Rng family ribonuclease [Hippea jasoniae]|uniref:Rne/Rng family ribonuclease n=1 Tax=Hippea jasoniae TaxID=944479 RepID=UPI000556412B|nr:Rne/Rng family ribonuclease [Hippea jasoniae]